VSTGHKLGVVDLQNLSLHVSLKRFILQRLGLLIVSHPSWELLDLLRRLSGTSPECSWSIVVIHSRCGQPKAANLVQLVQENMLTVARSISL
jgi:hypothetical protein